MDFSYYLVTLAVRGHRLAPLPREGAGPHAPRHTPPPHRDHRRYLTPEHAVVVEAVFRDRCLKRGGHLLAVQIRSTHAHGVVRLPWLTSQYGFADAVRLKAMRRLRREAKWGRGERVFTKRVRVVTLTPSEALETVERITGAGGVIP